MKADELKLRIVKILNELINIYFAEDTVIDKMANSTLKVLLEMNVDKIDEFLCLFKQEDGTIDAEKLTVMYASQIPDEGIKFDIRNYIKSNMIRSMMPDKSLIINKEDILKITKCEESNG